MANELHVLQGTEWGGSKLKVFQTCHQKFKYAYVDNLVPLGTGKAASDFGTYVHEGLRLYYDSIKTQPDMDSQDRTVAAITHAVSLIEAACLEGSDLELVRDEVIACLDQYFQKYQLDDSLEILEVEKHYEHVVRGFPVTLRIDLLAKWKLGNETYLIVPDHKTTGLDWGRFWKKWNFDLSLRGYCYHARKEHNQEVHILINAIRRTKHKNFTVEFDRQPVFMSDQDMLEYEDTIEAIHNDIKDRLEGRRAWEKNGDACMQMYECAYSKLCKTPTPEMAKTMYQIRNAGEEVIDVAQG